LHFLRKGFCGDGVDRIIDESGVAEATLYRHFPSKDDQIVASPQQADIFMSAWPEKTVRRLAAGARLAARSAGGPGGRCRGRPAAARALVAAAS